MTDACIVVVADDRLMDDWDPCALPRVLGRTEALRRGVSRHGIDHRLATAKWRRVLPHTYLTAESFLEVDRWAAALIYAGEGAALTGAAALRASDVRRIASTPTVVVLVPPSNRCRSYGFVQVRNTVRPFAVVQWHGPRRVEHARAAADLACTMRCLDDVRTLVARVVQDGHCTVAELAVELESGPRRGSAFLRRALVEVGWGAASAPEAQAAVILRAAGIGGFVQNARIELPGGRWRTLDFHWPQLRACLEIDSVEFHSSRDDWAATWNRHLELTTIGLSVVHRPPSALRDPGRFVAEIRAWLAVRADELKGR
ncbi:hypothetical protein [uncultured Jatrophihabitans sp.]|uniref:hypothetical protein n=1 Tax=uncultured Jatrophihabitans sp. TaxID=1610747 RepID=UPI0035CAA80A